MKLLTKALFIIAFSLGLPIYGMGSGGGANWGYEGAEGPSNWGNLSTGYATCKTGLSQSPIDISHTVKVNLGSHEFDYRDSPLKIINNGHTIQVNVGPDSHMRINGKTYQILQFHFHSPSENIKDGHPFAMEAHLVHKNDAGELAVVGVFMKEGASNPFIETLWHNLPDSINHEKVVPGVMVNPAELLPANGSYYHFSGSLTTPPCSEGVQWYVMKSPIEVSADQIRTFVSMVSHNARPIQPIGDRTVIEVTSGRVVFAQISTAQAAPAVHAPAVHAPAPVAHAPTAAVHTAAAVSDHGPATDDSHSVKKRRTTSRSSDEGHGEEAEPQGHTQEAQVEDFNSSFIWVAAIGGLIALALLLLIFRGSGIGLIDRMKIGGRVSFVIAVLIVAMAGVSGYGIIKMGHIGEELEGIAEQDIPMIELLTAIVEHQMEMTIWFERGLLRGELSDIDGIQESMEEIDILGGKVGKEIKNGEKVAEEAARAARTDEGRAEFEGIVTQLEKIEKENDEFEGHVFEVLELMLEGKKHEAEALIEKVEHEGDQVVHEIEQLLNEVEAFTNRAAKTAEHDEQNARKMMLLITGLATIIGIALGTLVCRGINSALRGVSEAVGTVASASEQLSSSSEELSQGATEQAASVEEA